MIDHKETLKNCIVALGNIRVPMVDIDNVGIPICQVRNTLIQIVNEMDQKPEVESAEENVKMAGEQDGETEAE